MYFSVSEDANSETGQEKGDASKEEEQPTTSQEKENVTDEEKVQKTLEDLSITEEKLQGKTEDK